MNDIMWQWTKRGSGLYQQPIIQPGQSSAWTFIAFPLLRGHWVEAVEFVWQGQVYRQEFDLGPLGNAHNYVDCGLEPASHPNNPTPTPRP